MPFKDTIVDCMCTENQSFQDQIQGASIEWGHSVKIKLCNYNCKYH